MKFCLLGGGNPYALNLARHLITNGHDVFGIGRSSLKRGAFSLENVGWVGETKQEWPYRYHVYSIGPDTEFVMDLLNEEEPEVIVNFAAQGEGQASFKTSNWKHFFKTNSQHLVELTEHLAYAGTMERFIQVGTSELYGSVEAASDELAPIRPTSPYAASKAAFDLHLLSIAKTCGFPAIVIRPSNAYCPGQQLHRVIPKVMLCGMSGEKMQLHGGGASRKSYLHADDLSRAILLLATEGKVGEVYNCGPKEPISIRKLVEFCAVTMGKSFEDVVEVVGERTGQDGCYWLNSDKLRALGWNDSIKLGLGLRGMLNWIENHPELREMPTAYRLRA